MCVVFCRCGISTRFSNRTPSASCSHTGRPAEPERREVSRAVEPVPLRRAEDAGQGDDAAIPETDLLPDVIEHHRPPERRWQRRNQQTVVSPRDGAGNRSARITAEAVRHQPFLPGQLFRPSGVGSQRMRRADQSRVPSRCSLSSHESRHIATPSLRRVSGRRRSVRESSTRCLPTPRACRCRHTQGLRSTSAPAIRIRPAAPGAVRKRSGDEIGTEVDPQQPLLRRPIEKVVQHERFGRQHRRQRSGRRAVRRTHDRRVASRSAPRTAAGGARACAPPVEDRALERARLVRRRQFSLHLAGCQARELRQELSPPFCTAAASSGRWSAKNRNASTRRTPAPEQ